MDEPAIQTFGLTRRFDDVQAVDDLHLSVPQGSVYAFLGPNGAGKTTTIRMLLGLVRPDAGSVRLLGTTLGSGTRRSLMGRVGTLVETPALYPHLTGYENLQITRTLVGLPRGSIDRALATIRLSDDAGRLVREYSLGMRQRLGIALALLAEPEVLVLDEPTNGLDPAGIREVRDFIQGLPDERRVTVFLSSHLLSEVEQLATHVGIVAGGRLQFQGSLPELQAQRRERAVVEVHDPSRALGLLRGSGWRADGLDADRIAVELSVRSDAARLAAALVGWGLDLYQLRIERPSLEEMFLGITAMQVAA